MYVIFFEVSPDYRNMTQQDETLRMEYPLDMRHDAHENQKLARNDNSVFSSNIIFSKPMQYITYGNMNIHYSVHL